MFFQMETMTSVMAAFRIPKWRNRTAVLSSFIVIACIFAVCILAAKPTLISSDIKIYTTQPLIRINARQQIGGEEKVYPIDIELTHTVAYVDMWRSHWCTYYNDRSKLYAPRVNELLQILRAGGAKVISISPVCEKMKPMPVQRNNSIEAMKVAPPNKLDEYSMYTERTKSFSLYMPGFRDTCIYGEQFSGDSYLNSEYTPMIALTNSDFFVSTFMEGALVALGSKAKTVLILGQHSNMCLMCVTILCRAAGLRPILVRDVVDSCWDYGNHRDSITSHSQANNVTNRYFESVYGPSILSYDLLRAIRKGKPIATQINYPIYNSTAFVFRHNT